MPSLKSRKRSRRQRNLPFPVLPPLPGTFFWNWIGFHSFLNEPVVLLKVPYCFDPVLCAGNAPVSACPVSFFSTSSSVTVKRAGFSFLPEGLFGGVAASIALRFCSVSAWARGGCSPPRRTEGMSEAAMRPTPEPAAHSMGAAHRGTMMPAHGRTAIAPAAHEGEAPIPRTAEQRRQYQNDDDEGQHGEVPPFFGMAGVLAARPAGTRNGFAVRSSFLFAVWVHRKRPAPRKPAAQVLPSR